MCFTAQCGLYIALAPQYQERHAGEKCFDITGDIRLCERFPWNSSIDYVKTTTDKAHIALFTRNLFSKRRDSTNH